MVVQADAVIYAEMMAHPILFTHPQAKSVLIIGDDTKNIKQEVAKHLPTEAITETTAESLKTILEKKNAFDVIIASHSSPQSNLPLLLNALEKDGLLIQESNSIFASDEILTLQRHLHEIGFVDTHLFNFPQPSHSLSWCGAILASKDGNCGRIREKDIFNKSFTTYYYNYDTHKAALSLPEFIRKELITE